MVQQPVNTPQRKKMRKADDARHVARKQVLAVDERLDEQGTSAGPVQAPTVLGQRQTAAAVLTGPIANGVQTVYPGKAGEELRQLVWRQLHQTWAASCLASNGHNKCCLPVHSLERYATLGRYPSWQLLLAEWKEGIPYLSTTIGTRKQTVPMAQLEQDWAEAVQRKNSPSVPWRSLDRNSIRDRKIVIYGLLQAELQGKDLKEFMAPHVAAAKSLMEKSGTGAKSTLLTYIKRISENDKNNYMSPVDFEQKVLMWKHTPQSLRKQKASSLQKAYPPEGIAQVA
ncbi:TPA: hypothetical protein ACH3X1_013075 [Trebouxia sp. C0004]